MQNTERKAHTAISHNDSVLSRKRQKSTIGTASSILAKNSFLRSYSRSVEKNDNIPRSNFTAKIRSMAGQVQYAQQTDDASRSACSRIHDNDSTAYYKRDDGKDLPARPFDDIPAGKTEKAKIHSQHKPGCHRHTISQCSHHKTAPFVLYSIKTIITSISYDMRRPPSKMRESFQRKQVYTKRMGMENPITPQSVIRLPLS